MEAAMRRVPAAGRVHEPGVGAAGVIGCQIQQDLHTVPGSRGDELIEIIKGPQVGMDAVVVADVIAPVTIRRGSGF
jgi:hypothetical protein